MTIEEIKELYKMIADRDDTVAVLYARIAELEAQVEKLKCCGNCKHIVYDKQTGELSCENDHYPFRVKGRCDNWIFDGRTRGRENEKL